MLSLQVIVGLNNTSASFLLANIFLDFLRGVRDRLSCCSPIWSGLYFRAILCIWVRASFVQACRMLHPSLLSSVQLRHVQSGLGECLTFPCISLQGTLFSFFTLFTRSATVVVLCFLRRQQEFALVIGCSLVNGWYQAGSIILTLVDRQIAARFVPSFLATFSILTLSSPRIAVLGPLLGGSMTA